MIDGLIIPHPVQLVIDDVGWREGWDVSESGGPFRAGVERLLGRLDYEAIVALGKTLCIRPQCAMVMCEWDTTNICANYPTVTHAGAAWDNTHRVGPWTKECANTFREHSAHVELALHGVGHEHWEDGERTRAEWFGRTPEDRWPWNVLTGHIECFTQLLDQHGLGTASGMSFPRSFVPCAFRFYWDSDDPESTGALVASAGVRYASTPYSTCTFAADHPERPDGGFEHGILVLDRGSSGIPWHVWDTIPDHPPKTPICGIHWPNLLTPDPQDNGQAVERWQRYLTTLSQQADVLLARNMGETCSQWVHVNYTSLHEKGDTWHLDASNVPSVARRSHAFGNPVVSFPLKPGTPTPSLVCDKGRIVARWQDGENAFLTVKLDNSDRCTIRPSDTLPGTPYVRRTGTYNVLDLRTDKDTLTLDLELFGRQQVPICGCNALDHVVPSGDGVTVHSVNHAPEQNEVTLDLSVADIQGQDMTIAATLRSDG